MPSYIAHNISLLYLFTWCLEIRSVPKKVLYNMSKHCSATTVLVNCISPATLSCDIPFVLLVYLHNTREDIFFTVMFFQQEQVAFICIVKACSAEAHLHFDCFTCHRFLYFTRHNAVRIICHDQGLWPRDLHGSIVVQL